MHCMLECIVTNQGKKTKQKNKAIACCVFHLIYKEFVVFTGLLVFRCSIASSLAWPPLHLEIKGLHHMLVPDYENQIQPIRSLGYELIHYSCKLFLHIMMVTICGVILSEHQGRNRRCLSRILLPTS